MTEDTYTRSGLTAAGIWVYKEKQLWYDTDNRKYFCENCVIK